MELRDHYAAIQATGADLWVIANDDPDDLRALRDSEQLPFPILLDPDATTFREWGIINDRDSRGRLIPHPTVVIVNAAGQVDYYYLETDYRVRPPSAELVERLESLTEAADSQRE